MSRSVTLFLCGDVMTGRGIDQILPRPCSAELYEAFVTSARDYVDLAERANGPIERPVDHAYIWGDALAELRHVQPAVRIVNLETSITTSNAHAPKGINYRMNPANVGCLSAAKIDCCVLANNHVMDWGVEGLLDTLVSLDRARIATVGAGRTDDEARAPCSLRLPGGERLLVFAYGCTDSGIPRDWAAGPDGPGVNLLHGMSMDMAAAICRQAREAAAPGDLLLASIHWGGNWGYRVSDAYRRFAHRLIDEGGFAVVHGHSSHHAKAIEIYRGRLVLYGCGDFLNDYEGISGHEAYRGDLAIMYLPRLSAVDGELIDLRLVPFQIRKFRLNRASKGDVRWLRDTLAQECAAFGTRIALNPDDSLAVQWS
jgi:poly-gamma-glutamate capsule biosynthesis protein CapA/YwtB (metallophosphatase superfamily)